MAYPNTSRTSRSEPIEELTAHFGRIIPRVIEKQFPACGPDDVVDAFAAEWTAERILNGQAITLPEIPDHDRFGLPMEIVA